MMQYLLIKITTPKNGHKSKREGEIPETKYIKLKININNEI
jgi:hypothetical protein